MSQPQPEYNAGDTIDLPLSKLILSKDNPRKTKDKDHDPILTASIRSRGLLQNLGVRPSPANEGKFEVRFGERRLKSLRYLTKCKHFAKDQVFTCKIVSSDDAEAEEAALAENIARKAMNPVDEFEAFSRLEDKGLSVGDIAERFGVTEKQVHQRLALGNAASFFRSETMAWPQRLKRFEPCDDGRGVRGDERRPDPQKVEDFGRLGGVISVFPAPGAFGVAAAIRARHRLAQDGARDRFSIIEAARERAGGVEAG